MRLIKHSFEPYCIQTRENEVDSNDIKIVVQRKTFIPSIYKLNHAYKYRKSQLFTRS